MAEKSTYRVAFITAAATAGAVLLAVMMVLLSSRQSGEVTSAEGTAGAVAEPAAKIPTQIGYSDDLAFFDPVSGEAAVWYYRLPDGSYDLFDAPGFHPLYGKEAPLQAITPLVAGGIRLSFSKISVPAGAVARRVAPRPAAPRTPAPSQTVISEGLAAFVPSSAPSAAPVSQTIVIPVGTRLDIVLDRQLSTETSKVGDTFPVSLARAVIVDGQTVLDQGIRLTGEITALERPGQVSGVAKMMLVLQSVNGIPIETASLSFEGRATKGKDAAKVGIGAGIGAAVGALFGGKEGAAKGTAVGAGGGAGVVLATRGEELVLSPEQEMTFVLSRDMTVQK